MTFFHIKLCKATKKMDRFNWLLQALDNDHHSQIVIIHFEDSTNSIGAFHTCIHFVYMYTVQLLWGKTRTLMIDGIDGLV